MSSRLLIGANVIRPLVRLIPEAARPFILIIAICGGIFAAMSALNPPSESSAVSSPNDVAEASPAPDAYERRAADAESLLAKQRATAARALGQKVGRCGGEVPVVQMVKGNLREPGSFELVDTKVEAPRSDGSYHVWVKYRARNGFGGMNIEGADAIVDGGTCQARLDPTS